MKKLIILFLFTILLPQAKLETRIFPILITEDMLNNVPIEFNLLDLTGYDLESAIVGIFSIDSLQVEDVDANAQLNVWFSANGWEQAYINFHYIGTTSKVFFTTNGGMGNFNFLYTKQDIIYVLIKFTYYLRIVVLVNRLN